METCMKFLSFICKKNVGVALFFVVTTGAMAQTPPSTSIEVCENIIQNFDKSVLTSLFDQDAVIKLQARYHFDDLATSGCVVHAMVKFPNEIPSLDANNGYYDLGSAIVFRQSNSQEMYESNKRAFAANDAVLDWGGTLQYVTTGYVGTTNPGYQIFNALLTDGDYVIFTYKGINSTVGSTPTFLAPKFAQFINAMSSQIVGN